MAGMLGHNAILLLEYTSDSLHDFLAFQLTAFLVALVAMGLMVYTGLHAHTVWDLRAAQHGQEAGMEKGDVEKDLLQHVEEGAKGKENPPSRSDGDNEPYWLKTWQVICLFLAMTET